MKTGLLNISDNPEKTRKNFLEVLSEFEVDTAVYNVREFEFPEPDEIDCAVITGSADSVYEDKEHVDALRRWIAENSENVPCFGVCYGHQAISDALGGKVEPVEEIDMELGYREVKHNRSELFDGIPETFTVFESHGDEVVELPEGGEILAENDVSIQALKIGHHYSVQFHPELGMDYAKELADDKEVSEETKRKALESITEENYKKALVARRVFDNFFDEVRKRENERNLRAGD